MPQPTIAFEQLDTTNIADARAVNSAHLFGRKSSTTTGLTFGYYGGTILVTGVLTTIADGTIVLAPSATNYVEATVLGVVSSNVVGFTAGNTPQYILVTSVTTITSTTDRRISNYRQHGALTKSVAGGTNVTMSADEARNDIFVFTGVLTANINVIVPTISKVFDVRNNTTGAFTLTVKTPAGTGVTVMQDKQSVVYCDAINVVRGHNDLFSFDGQAGWDDIPGGFLGARLGTGVNAPTWAVIQGGVYGYTFSATAMNEAWVSFHLPHDYMPGTVMYPHFHWASVGTGTGVVRWGFEYTLAKGYNQQAFPASTTIFVEQAGAGIALRHMIAEAMLANAIPATNLEPDVIIMVRIFRDGAHANDTLIDATFGFECDLHYQVGRASTKNRTFPFS